MKECKCITCEYCFKWCTGKQTQISCKGNKDIIYQYWKEHKIKKDFGFIGFMKEGEISDNVYAWKEIVLPELREIE